MLNMADAAPISDSAGISNFSNPQSASSLHAFTAEGLSAIVKEAIGGVKNYIDEALAQQKEQTVRNIETS